MAENMMESGQADKKATISLRGAVFIGIGSMVEAVWRAISKRELKAKEMNG